jgi:predicted  nucleic acid-binding Zn-ribbon protein
MKEMDSKYVTAPYTYNRVAADIISDLDFILDAFKGIPEAKDITKLREEIKDLETKRDDLKKELKDGDGIQTELDHLGDQVTALELSDDEKPHESEMDRINEELKKKQTQLKACNMLVREMWRRTQAGRSWVEKEKKIIILP